MFVGYARVSTGEQKLDLQLDALRQAGREKIFKDKVSGVKTERPGLDEAVSYARAGDTLVVWRLDRFGRSLKDLVTRIEELRKRDIDFGRFRSRLIQRARLASSSSIFSARLPSLNGTSCDSERWQVLNRQELVDD